MTINWDNLGYPDLPKYLELLVSNDENERDLAYQFLSDNCLDEPNNVSIHLVPIYLELLQQDIPEKDGLLHYLMRLASYSITLLRENQTADIAQKTLASIRQGIPLYKKLQNEEGDIGRQARTLLKYLE